MAAVLGSVGATQTAVIVPVARAEPAVGEHRRRLDPAASRGVPAHVTVLFPFAHPSEIDAALLARLAVAVSSVTAFECTFARCQWFGEDVLWIAPEPAHGFRALTRAVWSAFPQHPPYGGAFADVVPHLTVGKRTSGTIEKLRAAERAVAPALPFETTVDHVAVIAGTDAPGGWRALHRLPLGGASA